MLHQVMPWRTVPDAGGRVATNYGGSPAGHPPCLNGPRRVRSGQRQCGGTRILAVVKRTWTASGCVPGYVFTVKVPGPCVLQGQVRTHSGLVLVVNPGAGTALPRACSQQPSGPNNFPVAARLPRETNSLCLPVLHCVAASSLCSAVQRARTRAHRITPRPQWLRPG